MDGSVSLSVSQLVVHLGTDLNISTTIGWTATKLSTDIHDPHRMNFSDFFDPLTFPLAQPAGQTFYLSQHLPGLKPIRHLWCPDDVFLASTWHLAC